MYGGKEVKGNTDNNEHTYKKEIVAINQRR
jgi:hypothetical protein